MEIYEELEADLLQDVKNLY
jgi:hypothetical protein